MVRTKLILAIVSAIIALAGTGLWFLISEKKAAQERREKFFGSTKDYSKSGGKKMKIEW